MIYEWRKYEVLPGKMTALQEAMEKVVPLFEELKMTLIGAWLPIIGDYTNNFQYLMAFEDMSDREQKWQAFFAHPTWEMILKDMRNNHGQLIYRDHSSFLAPVLTSPLQ